MKTPNVVNKMSLLCTTVLLSSSICNVFGMSQSVAPDALNTTGDDQVTVKIYQLTDDPSTSGKDSVGTISFKDTKKGLNIKTQLQLPGVQAGSYGFHFHTNPSCAPDLKDGKMTAGMAAGDHLDPSKTKQHLGPYNKNGHLGDLPLLEVNAKGNSDVTLIAPRIKLSDIMDRSVMIHAGGDNYSDTPAPVGGGGARRYCGVIIKN